MDKRRDAALQVQQGMEFDGGFGLSEMRPGEDGQAQVDGGGVQGIDGVIEFDSQVVLGIQGSGEADEGVGEVGIQAPVALPVGVGQGIAGHAAAQAQVVELSWCARRQTSISRRLSRWVSWAKARQRNWSRQVKDLT